MFSEQETDTVWPVEEWNALATLAGTRASGKTLVQASNEFSDKSQVIAGSREGEPEFPNKVTIHGKCGVLCQSEFSARERMMHGKVCDALAELVSFDKPTRVVQKDILVSCRIEHTDGEVMRYFFMISISKKGGFNKAGSVQVQCSVIHQRSNDVYASEFVD